MWYIIFAQDVDVEVPLEKRSVKRSSHLARLRLLRDEGRLLTAGVTPAIDSDSPGEAGFTGSALIADFLSLGEARAWVDRDPYLDSVIIKPYKQVL